MPRKRLSERTDYNLVYGINYSSAKRESKEASLSNEDLTTRPRAADYAVPGIHSRFFIVN